MKRAADGISKWSTFGLCLMGAAAIPATAALTLSAWRKADLESEVWRAKAISAVQLATRQRALQLSAEAQQAALRAAEFSVAGYARSGKLVAYDAEQDADGAAGAYDSVELSFYEICRRGGESYEARGDAERAVDAYSFFLPRIPSNVLRARLRLAAARAAARGGDSRLARAIREELLESAPGVSTESGLPIDLVAALAILEEPGASQEQRQEIRVRIEERVSRIPTPWLGRVAGALGDSSGHLVDVLERRRLLERAVESVPEILTTRDSAVVEGVLLVARDEAKGVRSIRMAPWEESPAVERHELWTYQRAWSLAPPRDTGSEVAAEPIRLGGEGPLLGYVWTTGGMAFDVLQRLSQRSLGRIGAVAQAGVILLSCAALVLLLRRERQLARLREHLLANVSHELKSPVTSVRMFSELLGKPGLEPAEARGFARHLRRETARLGQLLENLLDLSHPERGESRLPAEPIDVAALLEEVGESFALRAREAGVEFRIECAGGEGAEGEGLVLVTNGPALERIVLNLLDNALKYRRAKDSRVILRLAASAGSASVSVEDNGPGVPARDRERIFEDFYRGRFEDFGVKGAGLGLSIARKLARQLGGDVRLIACSENGSTFLLTLPHRRASPAAGEAA